MRCYFIEEGLIKLTQNQFSGRPVDFVCLWPNDVLGEESFMDGNGEYHAEAEALTPSIVYQGSLGRR